MPIVPLNTLVFCYTFFCIGKGRGAYFITCAPPKLCRLRKCVSGELHDPTYVVAENCHLQHWEESTIFNIDILEA